VARIQSWENRQSIDIGGSFNAPDGVRPTTLAPIEVPFRETPNYAGDAMAGFGNAMSGLAANLGALAQEREATVGGAWASRARAELTQGWLATEADLRTGFGYAGGPSPSSPAGGARAAAGTAPGYAGEGYTQAAMAQFDAMVEERMKAAPNDRARQAVREWADLYSTQVFASSIEFEEQQLFAQRADDLEGASVANLQLIAANPGQSDTIWRRMEEDLSNAAQWMTPEQLTRTRSDLRHKAEIAKAQGIIPVSYTHLTLPTKRIV